MNICMYANNYIHRVAHDPLLSPHQLLFGFSLGICHLFDSTGLYWTFLGLIRLYWSFHTLTGSHWTFKDLSESYLTLLDLTWLYWTLLDLTGPYGPYWPLQELTVPYCTLMDLIGPYLTLLDLTGPYWTPSFDSHYDHTTLAIRLLVSPCTIIGPLLTAN